MSADVTGVESTLVLSGDPGSLNLGLWLKGAESTLSLSGDAGTFQNGLFFEGVESALSLSGDPGTMHTQYGWAGVESTLPISPEAGLLTLGLELKGVDSAFILSGSAGSLTQIAPPNYTTTNLSLTRRPGALAFDGLQAFDLGPVDFLDLREGLFFRPWRIRAVENEVLIARANVPNTDWQDEFLLFSYEGNQGSDFGLTFDQNGRPVVTYTQDGDVMLYWYDPVVGSMVIATVGAGRTPRVRLDIRSKMLSAISDVILMYLDDNNKLVFRLQRDRFGTLYETGLEGDGNYYLEETGLATNWRFYAWMSKYLNPGYEAISWHSDIYPYPMREMMKIKADRVLTADIRQAIELAAAKDTEISIDADSIVSAIIRDVMHLYEVADAEMGIDVDAIVSAIIRQAISTPDESGEYPPPEGEESGALSPHINQPAEVDFGIDDVISAAVRLAILTDTAGDEEIAFGVDNIVSATIT